MTDTSTIEVYQEMHLRGAPDSRTQLRENLLQQVARPWRHAVETEAAIARNMLGNDDVLAFERKSEDELPAASLVLWSKPYGYYLANIVPSKSGSLSYAEYNAILKDFVCLVASPAADRSQFAVDLTKDRQSITDWLSNTTAELLRTFSVCANKSTGASHPLDGERWFNFLISAHQDRRELGAENLVRWLIEAEHWPEETAHDLAIQYEFARDLLKTYDETR